LGVSVVFCGPIFDGAAFVSGWFGACPASAAFVIDEGSTSLGWRCGTFVVGTGEVVSAG
jgi:hypothetical protein